jgi:hypothetical protein
MSDEMTPAVPAQNTNHQNKKPCLYFAVFTEEEKQFYEQARATEGLADEVTLLRLKILSLVMREPQNMVLLLRALSCLEKLCKTHKKVFKQNEDDLDNIQENLTAMFQGIHIPPGFIEKKLN